MVSSLLNPEGWWMGVTLCKAWVTADVLFCSASIYSLIGISIDRFHALYRPISYNRSKNSDTNIRIVCAWLIASAIALPMHIDHPGFSSWARGFMNQTRGGEDTIICTAPHDAESAGYSLYASFVVFIIPFGILIIFYVAIAVRMRSRTKKKIKRIQKEVIFYPYLLIYFLCTQYRFLSGLLPP